MIRSMDPHTPKPQAGERFAGYLLEEVAGEGLLATVYRARSDEGELRALKIFRPDATDGLELLRRISGEQHAIAIRHPHVVHVHKAGEEGGRPFLVRQYVDGPSLRELLDERGRLEPALAAIVTAQVAGALDAAHAFGRVHRAVNPDNILLQADLDRPHAYLSDFTMSRAPAEDNATQIGMVAGVGPYVAPEAIIGTGEPDGRSDVYSLACVLFECLTGSIPFPAEDTVMAIFARTSQPAPSVVAVAPQLDSRWHEILERGLATEPGDRYASAGDLGRAALEVVGRAPDGQ